jgi:transcriptional regulator with XRE-family HTH domain
MSSPYPATEDTRRLGEYVRRSREQTGVTQYQLAERLGCKQPAISRLESGGVSPNLSTLHRIAEALGLQLEIQMVPRDQVFTTGQPFRFTSARSADPSFRLW